MCAGLVHKIVNAGTGCEQGVIKSFFLWVWVWRLFLQELMNLIREIASCRNFLGETLCLVSYHSDPELEFGSHACICCGTVWIGLLNSSLNADGFSQMLKYVRLGELWLS